MKKLPSTVRATKRGFVSTRPKSEQLLSKKAAKKKSQLLVKGFRIATKKGVVHPKKRYKIAKAYANSHGAGIGTRNNKRK